MRKMLGALISVMVVAGACVGGNDDAGVAESTVSAGPTVTADEGVATEPTDAPTSTAEPAQPTPSPTVTPVSVHDLEWEVVPGAIPGASGNIQVIAGGPGLIAVGADANDRAGVWLSEDGRTWQQAGGEAFTSPIRTEATSAAVGGPGLVVVGFEVPKNDNSENNPAVWTSVDGTDWARVEDPAFYEPALQEMWGVAAAGPGLVAVGVESPPAGVPDDSTVWVSADGQDWERVVPYSASEIWRASPEVGGPHVLAGGPGVIFVHYEGPLNEMSDALVWVSSDGFEWESVAVPGPGSEQMAAVTVGGRGFVAVGSDDTRGPLALDIAAWWSTDGLAWERVPSEQFAQEGNQQAMSVAPFGTGVVAVGYDTNIAGRAAWGSDDSLHWNQIDLPGPKQGILTTVTPFGDGLIAITASGTVYIATPQTQ